MQYVSRKNLLTQKKIKKSINDKFLNLVKIVEENQKIDGVFDFLALEDMLKKSCEIYLVMKNFLT